jgi:hypothetical protein
MQNKTLLKIGYIIMVNTPFYGTGFWRLGVRVDQLYYGKHPLTPSYKRGILFYFHFFPRGG